MSEHDDDSRESPQTVSAPPGLEDRADGNGTCQAIPAEEVLAEDLSYAPVPPRRSFTLRVSCRFQGRGQPLPIPLEDA